MNIAKRALNAMWAGIRSIAAKWGWLATLALLFVTVAVVLSIMTGAGGTRGGTNLWYAFVGVTLLALWVRAKTMADGVTVHDIYTKLGNSESLTMPQVVGYSVMLLERTAWVWAGAYIIGKTFIGA